MKAPSQYYHTQFDPCQSMKASSLYYQTDNWPVPVNEGLIPLLPDRQLACTSQRRPHPITTRQTIGLYQSTKASSHYYQTDNWPVPVNEGLIPLLPDRQLACTSQRRPHPITTRQTIGLYQSTKASSHYYQTDNWPVPVNEGLIPLLPDRQLACTSQRRPHPITTRQTTWPVPVNEGLIPLLPDRQLACTSQRRPHPITTRQTTGLYQSTKASSHYYQTDNWPVPVNEGLIPLLPDRQLACTSQRRPHPITTRQTTGLYQSTKASSHYYQTDNWPVPVNEGLIPLLPDRQLACTSQRRPHPSTLVALPPVHTGLTVSVRSHAV